VHTAVQPATLGATLRNAPGNSPVDFHLWAPYLSAVTLRLQRRGQPPEEIPMLALADGYWAITLEAAAGDRYQYSFGGLAIPDPVSRLLPEGVHGPTEIVDPAFPWSADSWHGLALSNFILYELHVGTFTHFGTLDAAISRLDYLRDLGVTAIELMPLNAVPGPRNWGYDGVGLYSVQSNYGGPAALCRFVDAAHLRGLAVILDVVYNHLGNEGNYLSQLGPYFTSHHKTPWGDAINYDDTGSPHVRRFIVENALYWLREYRLDGLRLDAAQTICDDSPTHIVAEIAARAHQLGQAEHRAIVVTVETDENQPRYVLPPEQGGYGADAVWSDDFHHTIHVLLTGEQQGYYQDFTSPDLFPRVLSEPYAFQGEPFRFWQGRPRGAPAVNLPLPSQIICIQNHDQVGNRALGERLTSLAPAGARKFAAAMLLLSPHTPLLFMGQEYDEPAPFQFFTSFSDPIIQQAVTEGRVREFSEFGWTNVPDPQDPATFQCSRLQWPQAAGNLDMLDWYRRLLRLRHKFILTPGSAGDAAGDGAGDGAGKGAHDASRTAHAEWNTVKNLLTVQVPANFPRIKIIATLPDKEHSIPPGVAKLPLAGANNDWILKLENNQDGYRTQIYIR
jgi:maltooligosyltrehalose trehalohydrolase